MQINSGGSREQRLSDRVLELEREIERLREALREIANDDLSHRDRPNLLCAIARAALGEENPFEDQWDD